MSLKGGSLGQSEEHVNSRQQSVYQNVKRLLGSIPTDEA